MSTGDGEDRSDDLAAEVARLRSRARRAELERVLLGLIAVAALVAAIWGDRIASFGRSLREPEPRDSAAEPALLVEGGDLAFRKKRGNNTVLIYNDKFGAPIIGLIGPDKRMKVHLRANDEAGVPSLQFFGEGGVRFQVVHEPGGRTVLELLGPDQRGGVFLSVAPDGTPMLQLRDRDGTVVFEAPPRDAGPSSPASAGG
jgi:hypothetical protein